MVGCVKCYCNVRVCVCQSKRFTYDPSPWSQLLSGFCVKVRLCGDTTCQRMRKPCQNTRNDRLPPENTINRAIQSRIRGHLHTNSVPVWINDGWAHKFRLHHAFQFSASRTQPHMRWMAENSKGNGRLIRMFLWGRDYSLGCAEDLCFRPESCRFSG